MSLTGGEVKALRQGEIKVDNQVLNFLSKEEKYFSVAEIAEALDPFIFNSSEKINYFSQACTTIIHNP